MSRRASVVLVAAVLVAGGAALSCGEVPTLQDGIAYITPVQLPLPTVAAGDTLRDSLGVATPLRVRAFTRDSQEITGLTVTFVPTALPTLVNIDANGYLVALDTVGSVQLVGRIGDRLQTSVVTLQIVPDPRSIARPAGDEAADRAPQALPALKALPVTVSGIFRSQSTPVNGIIVRYRIDSLRPVSAQPGSAIFVKAAGESFRTDSTIAVDTTKGAGTATRTVLLPAGTGVDTVFMSASARRLRDGRPLDGSPVRFLLIAKPPTP